MSILFRIVCFRWHIFMNFCYYLNLVFEFVMKLLIKSFIKKSRHQKIVITHFLNKYPKITFKTSKNLKDLSKPHKTRNNSKENLLSFKNSNLKIFPLAKSIMCTLPNIFSVYNQTFILEKIYIII